jgi:hypothetical protein
MSQVSANEILTRHDTSSEEIIRLKVTVYKGARIKSVLFEENRKIGNQEKTILDG